MSHPYPAELPTSDLLEIINDIRGGLIQERKAHFANCCWALVGYGLKIGIGDPDSDGVFGAADISVDDHALNECQVALVHAKNDLSEPSFGAAEGEGAIDPATLLMLVELAMKIIAKIRERRKQ